MAGMRRFALFMLILIGTGFGVMMWVDPVFRQKTVDWTKTSFERLHAYATAQDMRPRHAEESADGSADPADASKPAKDDAESRKPSATPKLPPSAGEPAIGASAIGTPAIGAPAKISSKRDVAPEPPPVPVPAPAAVNPAPTPPAPASALTEPTKASAEPASPAAPPGSAQQPPAEKQDAIPATYEGQVAREMELYKAGRRAEYARPPDYAAALKAYTEIKRLPKELWHSDLDARIDDVKRKMK
jgi:hypothetical protein